MPTKLDEDSLRTAGVHQAESPANGSRVDADDPPIVPEDMTGSDLTV
jgi:hypothetical protein